ncbi:tryptophan synthase, alpha chain [Pseudarcicella hirudinis]|uniref:Tryptophan synthase alpha chain n=1 Tax=Pseudarcicella hirudinis TaxID=1079859 RepID=A0A1I5Q7P7_9BACT|nr:tryptophan synthase subunit alpha [Pseudarcicella hirudinis]SFP41906.1 tryptophan synthase, alpha chain [Pseudarcicella hirudinis]
MNRITQLFQNKKQDILNVYFTAGFPDLNDTVKILTALDEGGADLIEIGMPYSDPVADGETIQLSNQKALDNGMSVKLLFEQLKDIRKTVNVPILLMGYINPVLQYGIEAFCKKCQEVGVDGLILPDLPVDVYEEEYKSIFEQYNLLNTFLITPQTSDVRINHIDNISNGFIYMVSSASTTGAKTGISEEQEAYFAKVNAMNLKNPRLIGFGISNHESFKKASSNAQGAIIGSAFIKVLNESTNLEKDIKSFVHSIKYA